MIDLDNIFFPSDCIRDPKWFAGRKIDIEKALHSLCKQGASMLVYGERGAGKSSFVEMIKQIAEGNSHLIYKYSLHKRFLPEKFKYKVISVTCNAQMNTTEKVLQNLITSPNGIKQIISNRVEKIEQTSKDKYLFDFLNFFSFGEEGENKTTLTSYREENIFEIFTNLILTISKEILNKDEGLLIVVDEFDLVENSSEMATLIKTLSTGNIKFLIAGIAESYEHLLEGHSSVSRQLLYGRIRIDLMSDEEIFEIFNQVEKNTNRSIRFEKSFIEKVIEKSNRYPYFVQLFGQVAIDMYYEQKGYHTPMIIHNQHLSDGIKRIGLFEEERERAYLNIIKENPYKEFIIKYIAKHTSNKVSDEEILSYCYKQNIRQPIPKNTLINLLGNREPHFLVRERGSSDYVLFSDKLFKTYVNAREPELIRIENNEFIIP